MVIDLKLITSILFDLVIHVTCFLNRLPLHFQVSAFVSSYILNIGSQEFFWLSYWQRQRPRRSFFMFMLTDNPLLKNIFQYICQKYLGRIILFIHLIIYLF